MDRATASLKHILESGEYVRVPGVVVFDEHEERDKNGKLLRKFGRPELQEIANKCNQRAAKTGDLAPGGPGHTLDNPKSEEDQPPIWFYSHNYRVDTFGPEQTLGLIADYYVRRRIRTKDGQVVDGPEHLKTFPRRSIELWPNNPAIPEHARNTIDWHAVLRRSPQRDLGLSVYQQDTDVGVLKYAMQQPHSTICYSPRQSVIGVVSSSGKLRYLLEPPMPLEEEGKKPDPVEAPDAAETATLDEGDEAPPEGHEEFAKHLDYAMNNHPHLKKLGAMCAKYDMDGAGAAPTPTNAALPGTGDEDEGKGPEPFSRNGKHKPGEDDVQVTRYQRDIDELKAQAKAAQEELALNRHQSKILKFQRTLEEMSDEWKIDVPAEMEEVAGLDDKGFEKHVARIKRSYERTPVGGDLPSEAFEEAADPQTKNLDNPEVAGKVYKYMTAHPELAQKYGEGAFKEAARALKIIG